MNPALSHLMSEIQYEVISFHHNVVFSSTLFRSAVSILSYLVAYFIIISLSIIIVQSWDYFYSATCQLSLRSEAATGGVL